VARAQAPVVAAVGGVTEAAMPEAVRVNLSCGGGGGSELGGKEVD